jgi:hypothetical protein
MGDAGSPVEKTGMRLNKNFTPHVGKRVNLGICSE